jgi:ATP-dependent RNA helicase DDX24/MAK5
LQQYLEVLKLTYLLDREDQISAEFDDGNHGKSKDEKRQEDVLQTFVFSATLSKDLQRNLKRKVRPKGISKKNKEPASTLGSHAGFRDDPIY